jgi:HAD superfamily hydrolase (TIGR01509 family)
MMGMSTQEWARYLADELGVGLAPDEVARTVIDRMEQRYRARLPLLPGATTAVERMAAHWPVGLASSSPPRLIQVALEQANLLQHFATTISTEEVARGKPAPDVYLLATTRLGVEPEHTAAIEDSTNGLRSASAAGMRLIAVPRPEYPPAPDALGAADLVLFGLQQLTADAVEHLG